MHIQREIIDYNSKCPNVLKGIFRQLPILEDVNKRLETFCQKKLYNNKCIKEVVPLIEDECIHEGNLYGEIVKNTKPSDYFCNHYYIMKAKELKTKHGYNIKEKNHFLFMELNSTASKIKKIKRIIRKFSKCIGDRVKEKCGKDLRNSTVKLANSLFKNAHNFMFKLRPSCKLYFEAKFSKVHFKLKVKKNVIPTRNSIITKPSKTTASTITLISQKYRSAAERLTSLASVLIVLLSVLGYPAIY